MAGPENHEAKVQTEAEMKATAIAEARKQVAPEPPPEPEAAPQDTGTPPAPTGEIDWTNAEARETYLKEKFLPKDEHEKRLKNQFQSYRDKLALAEEAERQKHRDAMLADLDRLADEDPEAFGKRVREDAAAAQALSERASTIPPHVMQGARVKLALDQARVLFGVLPDLEAVAAEGGDRWADVVNPDTGGVFGYIRRTSLDEGKRQGVEDFKKSKEYKDAIATAERRGAQNTMGEFAVGTPAPEGAAPVGTEPPVQKFDDPVKQAAAEAARALGRTVDLSKIRAVRAGVR